MSELSLFFLKEVVMDLSRHNDNVLLKPYNFSLFQKEGDYGREGDDRDDHRGVEAVEGVAGGYGPAHHSENGGLDVGT